MSLIDRLSNLWRRPDLNTEIDEELQFHLDARAADNEAAGMDAREARRDARLRFGSAAAVREDTRDANLVAALDTLRQDVTFAVRSLRKRPGFSATVILTLALGIGATTAMFTIVERVVLRPLPFPEPDRVYALSRYPVDQPFWVLPGMPDGEFVALRSAGLPFSSVASLAPASVTLTGAGDAVRMRGATATPEFFRVLGVHPAAGRVFVPEDAASHAAPVVMVSDALRRDRFGSEPSLVGRAIELDGVPHTVIGVLPPGFSYPEGAKFWTPFEVRVQPGISLSRPVIARLRADATPAAARAAFEAFAATQDQSSANVVGFTQLQDAVVGNVQRPLWIFAGAVACLLLIACTNVANLTLVRSVSRQQEIATRRGLGATRGRIIRQLLTESTVLSVIAGAAGMGVAAVGVPALTSLVPPGILPRASEIDVDGWALSFALAVSILTGLVVGLTPALYATRGTLAGAIKEGPAGSRVSHRLRHTLIVAEVGLALVLLIAAGLLGRSFLTLRGIDPGFRAADVMTMTISLPSNRYATTAQLNDFHDRVLSSLSTHPAVASAAMVNWLPFGDVLLRGDVAIDGGRSVPREFAVVKAGIGPHYFETMGMPLQLGRSFTHADRAGSERVAIVSSTVARTLWPGESPIGRRISTDTAPRPPDWLTVVGVVGDVKHGLKAQPAPALYQPYGQVSRRGWLGNVTFVARPTSGGAEELGSAMRGVLRAVDSQQAPESLVPMADRIGASIAESEFHATLIGVFSGLGLLLAGVGIYGVLAAAVLERRREIGIRLALGAGRGSIVTLVLFRVLGPSAVGVAIGLGVAYGLSGALGTLLFEITPTDIPTFAVSAGVLILAALVAAMAPARRASRVDPLQSLRAE